MLTVVETAVSDLTVNPRNARTHSKKQIRQIANSIRTVGFVNPILVDEDNVVIAGHGRLEAAKLLKMSTVPAITLGELSEAKQRLYLIADNKIALNAGWDRQLLALEIPDLCKVLEIDGLDITQTGFEIAEIDEICADFEADEPKELIEGILGPPVSRSGDLWLMGEHRLLCGNARSSDDVSRLLESQRAAMAFHDPPYNIAISKVVGRGRHRHREFAEAVGELSGSEFVSFLSETLGNSTRVSKPEAVHFVCMDWRRSHDLLTAATGVYGAHLNTAVWVKNNAGLGSLYRAQHEFVHIFRVGSAQHQNNIELGRHGRSRTNVWNYPGNSSFRSGRMTDLSVHPTVKPLALVSDAIRDVTKRGDVVLDCFCGSGTTVLAADKVGRRGYGLELDPLYVDVAVRRWQASTGKDAVHSDTGQVFDEMASSRGADHATKEADNNG